MVEKVLVERYVVRCPKCGRIVNELQLSNLKQAEKQQALLDGPSNRCTGRTVLQDPEAESR